MKNLFRFLQFVAQCITLGLAFAFVVSLFAPQWVDRLRGRLGATSSADSNAPADARSARAAQPPADAGAGTVGFGPAGSETPHPDSSPAGNSATITTSYASAVKHATPAVVSIKVTKIQSQLFQPRVVLNDPRLGIPVGEIPVGPVQSQNVSTPGLGSGVIFNSDGYVLTNSHVIDGATDIRAVFQDGRSVAAKLVGSDKETDLAVLLIDSYDTPHVEIAQTAPAVGDVVLAIGSPFGLGNTVTMGIVSAVGRQVNPAVDEDFIQTDAAINEGNSGGALVNARGELIGINSNTYSPTGTGGNVGIGFAIPVNIAIKALSQIIHHGHVIRAWMGATYQDSQPQPNDPMPVITNGAQIAKLAEGSPAAKAGLQVGDIVTRLNGQWIPNQFSLRNRESHLDPGTKVDVAVLRAGNLLKFEVVLEEKPNTITAHAGSDDKR